MKNLLSCISKDIRIFGRSRFSAFVTVIIPLVIVLLVGTAFSSNSLQGIKVGTYSSSYSELTESVLSNFEEQSFNVLRLDSEESCSNSVRSGEVQLCVIFPADLSEQGNEDPVVFHVDESRVNIAYLLIDDIRGEISSKSSELELELVGGLISDLESIRDSISEQKSSIDSAKSAVADIESDASEISVPSVSSILESLDELNDIVDELNASNSEKTELKESINSTRNSIVSLQTSLSGLTSNAENIKDSSSEANDKLSEVSGKLGSLITQLSVLTGTDAEKVTTPIKTEIKSVNIESTNWDFFFPTLLALMVMFGSTILASVLAIREKNTKAYFRNFITPTSDFTFLIGMYVTCMIIFIVQLAVLFSGLFLVTDFAFIASLSAMPLILFISATSFIFLGLFIGHLFRSEETVVLAAMFIISFMMFFSNAIFPVEAILGNFQHIAYYNPLFVSASMLKKSMLFGLSLNSMWLELAILVGSLVLFFILAFVARKATKRML